MAPRHRCLGHRLAFVLLGTLVLSTGPLAVAQQAAPAPPAATPSVGTSNPEFLATADGLSLAKCFMRIKDLKLRRSIVNLVEQIATHYN